MLFEPAGGMGFTTYPSSVSSTSVSAASPVSPADHSHLRFFMVVAGRRGEVVELIDLLGRYYDAVGGGVLLDAGDALGAGDGRCPKGSSAAMRRWRMA